ncbi:MAG: hypothetical protein IKG46_09260 [Solobacterium sp.]|nr:hypothetical protein [Solobacterium sp.]
MNYRLMSGNLYAEGNKTPAASLKYDMFSNEKRIYDRAGQLVYTADIVNEGTGSVRQKKYVLRSLQGVPVITAYPGYAEAEDPEIYGWPLARLPKTDHADLKIKGEDYTLIMQNSQYYVMNDESEKPAVSVIHRGIGGGWNIETSLDLTPEILLAVFVFCRNIESENELIIV